jgi:spore maturation protein CgeB
MSFKLLTIGSIYPGCLQSFELKNSNYKELTYENYYEKLLEDSTEFVTSYTKTFNRLGIEASSFIVNSSQLNKKWSVENNLKSEKKKSLLYEIVKKKQPEVLLLEDLRFIDLEWIASVRKNNKRLKKIIAHYCAPLNSNKVEILRNIDFLLTCTPGLKLDFENLGIKTYSVYHGFDNELLPKIITNNDFHQKTIVFTGSLNNGSGYHSDRIELIESILKAKIDISLYLNLEKIWKIRAKQSISLINEILKKVKLQKLKLYFPVLESVNSSVKNYSKSIYKANQHAIYGLEMYKLLSKSGIILNNHIDVAGNFAGNMRLFEATGLGTCLLTDNKKNMPELFEANSEVVVYDSHEDCIRKIQWLLENENERNKIALAGQHRTLKDHRVEDRCRLIIEIIVKELSK